MSDAAQAAVAADDLAPDTRAALRRLVLSLADSKRLMGIRYSDWLLGAPSIETGIAASGMAQDEWGHARLLYAMLKDFGEDPVPVEHDRPAEAYTSVDALDRPFEDWAEVVAGMVVVDGALAVALEAFAEGRYDPARARVPKMIAEEAFHGDLARAWARRLAGGSAEARTRLREAIEALLPRTLAWLAPGDGPHASLVEAGLYPGADALRSRFGERVAPALEAAGVAGAVEPDRAQWDEARGRGPGQPDDEAVERARGDRNRELFVE